jgi:hypothetical protein
MGRQALSLALANCGWMTAYSEVVLRGAGKVPILGKVPTVSDCSGQISGGLPISFLPYETLPTNHDPL